MEQNANIRANEQDEKPNDYDYYDNQPGQRYMQSMRRNWNLNNRGTRSEDAYGTKRCKSSKNLVNHVFMQFISAPSSYESLLQDMEKGNEGKKQEVNSQTVKKVSSTVAALKLVLMFLIKSKVLDDSEVKKSSQPMVEPRAETLWDIEIEKENVENHKNRKRRETQLLNQNVLPSVSSTGVLVESLDKANSTLDFVFLLNIRESESFPPLLLQSDVHCVEEKMAALGGFPQASEIVEWQKNFLKDCLKARLMKFQQPEPLRPSYETQVTIVRLSISCTCNELNLEKEVCSTFKNIREQKWTEYMGNQLDGTYSN